MVLLLAWLPLLFLKSTDNNLQEIVNKQRMIQDSRYKKVASGSTEVLIIPSTLPFCSVEMHPVQQVTVKGEKNDNRPSPVPSLWPSISQVQDVECWMTERDINQNGIQYCSEIEI